MVEATAVEPQGRITPWDVGLWSDDHVKGLAKIVQFAHTQGQKMTIQLAHAGRKASNLPLWAGAIVAEKEVGGWPDDVCGPSPDETYCPVKELTQERIRAGPMMRSGRSRLESMLSRSTVLADTSSASSSALGVCPSFRLGV
ncbi:hypothetical protein BKA70DRAFT_399465 [Coprinopsis sp. MPI-PUGE-AT-0042]|nr:hypothetical protein BKA70DRAFT_399465 [Coprinopsis sp. MPI-PUGE-AT-0042]